MENMRVLPNSLIMVQKDSLIFIQPSFALMRFYFKKVIDVPYLVCLRHCKKELNPFIHRFYCIYMHYLSILLIFSFYLQINLFLYIHNNWRRFVPNKNLMKVRSASRGAMKYWNALTLSRLGGLSGPPRTFCQKCFFENFLILKSFKRKIKLTLAQFLSYQTHF